MSWAFELVSALNNHVQHASVQMLKRRCLSLLQNLDNKSDAGTTLMGVKMTNVHWNLWLLFNR